MKSEEHYRVQAERLRQWARETKLPTVRELLVTAAAHFEFLANLVSNLVHQRRAEERTLETLHHLEPHEETESARDGHPKEQDAKRLGKRSK